VMRRREGVVGEGREGGRVVQRLHTYSAHDDA
jgi:hypothetical protein